MKNVAILLLLFAALLLGRADARAQGVGIGTATPDASAALDVASTARGLLVPRLALTSLADAATVAAPAAALLVFNTNAALPGGAGFYYNAGTPAAPAWTRLNTGPAGGADNLGNHTATQTLNLQANALTGTGATLGAAVGLGVRADGGLNLAQNTAGSNFFLGYQTGQSIAGDPEYFIDPGAYNQFVGYQAGKATTTGSGNHFDGYQSGQANTTGSRNVFSGYQSGYANMNGGENQFSGYQSGYATIGSSNVFVGYRSGYRNTTGYANQFVGHESGYANTTGNNNQFSGKASGYFNTTGSYNQFYGYQSGFSNTTGSYNWAFGHNAGPDANNLTNTGALGTSARVSRSNSLILGGTGTYGVNVGIGTTAPSFMLDVNGNVRCYILFQTSDQRLKQAIRPLAGALAGVQRLRGVRYTFRRAEFKDLNLPADEQLGLLAQEVARVYPELVSTDEQGYQAVNYVQLVPVLIEAIKELKAENDAANARANRAETTTAAFEQRLRALEAGGARAQATPH